MQITILTVGSRGDIQPFIALGQALQKQGHQVTIAASEGFQHFVEGYGLQYARVRGDVAKIANSELGKEALEADNPLKFFTSLKNERLLTMLIDATHDLHEACTGADAILYHPGAAVGYFAAQAMGLPAILASPFPMAPTGDYPSLLFYDGPRLGRLYNRLTHRLFELGFWLMLKAPLQRYWKQRFGRLPDGWGCPFPRQRTATHPTLLASSPAIFGQGADWPAHVHAYGFWFLDSDPGYQPPADLQRFLDAGEPPVYVGFGSVPDAIRAAETTALVTDALRRAGRRGILAAGWNSMARPVEPAADLLFIDGAPHDWLFPRMAAVVHHGGAGTTAAALRAGVPAVVVPFGNDQFAWGRRVHELGVGARPIPRKQLTAEGLAAALRAVASPAVRDAARAMGERIRAENGAQEAAAVISGAIDQYYRQGRGG